MPWSIVKTITWIVLFHLPEKYPIVFLSGENKKKCVFNCERNPAQKYCETRLRPGCSHNDRRIQSLVLTISDNGNGFKENNKGREGNGLRNMHKRIESIGDAMDIRNGKGITVI